MLSASHNPMPDNGIKLFAAGGHKLPDEVEMQIEAAIARRRRRPARGTGRPVPASAGCTTCSTALTTTSSTWSAPCRTGWTGCKVVVDCANGAASRGRARSRTGRPAPR